MHQKRIKDSFFEDDSTLQGNILIKTRDITSLIKQSESKLKELVNVKTKDRHDEQSKLDLSDREIVRQNMCSILAEKLKTVTVSLRKIEKEHFSKVQEIHGSEGRPS